MFKKDQKENSIADILKGLSFLIAVGVVVVKLYRAWYSQSVETDKVNPRARRVQFATKAPQKPARVQKAKTERKPVAAGLNARQQIIYRLLQQNSQLDMTKVTKEIKGVTERTLRRDLTAMEKMGMVKKQGKTRDSVYILRQK